MKLIILWYFLALIFAFALLWFSGEMSVRYSVKAAHLFKITTLFIGFFVIALSTGLPELSVIFVSAFKNVSSIGVATIIGSLLSDIGFALGITSFFVQSITITKQENRNMIIMLLASMVIISFVYYIQKLDNSIGIFLIMLYFALIWWIYKDQSTLGEVYEKKNQIREVVNKKSDATFFFPKKIAVLIKLSLSLILMLIASELVVRFIVNIANYYSFSMPIIGATISGLATSLPELTLGISAVKKKEYALALGNIVGSVLEEASFLLGVAVLASPEAVSLKELNSLIPFLALTLGIMIYALGKNKAFKRIHGILLFIIFVIFMASHLFF